MLADLRYDTVDRHGKVTLLIRRNRTTSAQRRFEKIVEESPTFDLLHANGVQAKPASTNSPTLRIEAVRDPMKRMIDGEPGMLVLAEGTRRLLGNLFELNCVAGLRLTGLSLPSA